MVTVIDPAGTPIPVYNRTGVTIVFINGAGTTQGAATAIGRVASTTVVMVASGPTTRGVRLPSDAEIGDVVEVYCETADSGTTPDVYPPSGWSIGVHATNEQDGVSVNSGRRYIKVSATRWQVLGEG